MKAIELSGNNYGTEVVLSGRYGQKILLDWRQFQEFLTEANFLEQEMEACREEFSSKHLD